MKKLLVLLGIAVMLTACGASTDPSDGKLNEREVIGTESEVQEDDFIYRLVTEKAAYEDGSEVKIYAELEYVGDQAQVKITHAASPFFFPMKELTREYEIGYGMNEPLLSTVLKKGEPLREEYNGSGGFSGQDSSAFKEFIQEVMDGDFPKGFYEVYGYADFNYNEQKYNIETQVQFKVTKKSSSTLGFFIC
ncbi:hypothetical protein [Piscibacillus salipiscarius]|uniref:DUF5067 domain-containing protein n=1 Tax=Piscibacillus salipiscarius TaxID=299480 RepID=A0ABW5QAL0_9BACI|nr:hypothetical protein [Piscibacillus salipiscarius]